VRRASGIFLIILSMCLSCGTTPSLVLPVETELLIVNTSSRWYVTMGLRSDSAPDDSPFQFQSKLIAPGALLRERFINIFPDTGGCPDRFDMRVHLYKRLNEDLPIGLDSMEEVDPTPVASAELLNILACEVVVASSYTIVLRDSQEGMGILKFAQELDGEQDGTFSGNALEPLNPVPALLDNASLSGRVIMSDGAGIEGVGVLLRTRVRRSDNDPACCSINSGGPANVEDATSCCWDAPIAVVTTDAEGQFSFDRPPGAYWVEVFADSLLFRPVAVTVESPIDNITFIGEVSP